MPTPESQAHLGRLIPRRHAALGYEVHSHRSEALLKWVTVNSRSY